MISQDPQRPSVGPAGRPAVSRPPAARTKETVITQQQQQSSHSSSSFNGNGGESRNNNNNNPSERLRRVGPPPLIANPLDRREGTVSSSSSSSLSPPPPLLQKPPANDGASRIVPFSLANGAPIGMSSSVRPIRSAATPQPSQQPTPSSFAPIMTSSSAAASTNSAVVVPQNEGRGRVAVTESSSSLNERQRTTTTTTAEVGSPLLIGTTQEQQAERLLWFDEAPPPAPRALPQLRQPSPTRRRDDGSYQPFPTSTPLSQQRAVERKSLPQASPLATGARSPRSAQQPVDPSWADLAKRYYDDNGEEEQDRDRVTTRRSESPSQSQQQGPKLTPSSPAPHHNHHHHHHHHHSSVTQKDDPVEFGGVGSNSGGGGGLGPSSTSPLSSQIGGPSFSSAEAPSRINSSSQMQSSRQHQAPMQRGGPTAMVSIPSNLTTASSESNGSSTFRPVPTEVHSPALLPEPSSYSSQQPASCSVGTTTMTQQQQQHDHHLSRGLQLRLSTISSQLSDPPVEHPNNTSTPLLLPSHRSATAPTAEDEDGTDDPPAASSSSFRLAECIEIDPLDGADGDDNVPHKTGGDSTNGRKARGRLPSQTEGAASQLVAASMIVHDGDSRSAMLMEEEEDDDEGGDHQIRQKRADDAAANQLKENRMVRLSEWCHEIPKYHPAAAALPTTTTTTASSSSTTDEQQQTAHKNEEASRADPPAQPAAQRQRRNQRSTSIQFLRADGSTSGDHDVLPTIYFDSSSNNNGTHPNHHEDPLGGKAAAAVGGLPSRALRATISPDHEDVQQQLNDNESASTPDAATLHSPSQKKHWLNALRHAQNQIRVQQQQQQQQPAAGAAAASSVAVPALGASANRRPTFLNIVATLVKQKLSSRGLRLGVTGDEVLRRVSTTSAIDSSDSSRDKRRRSSREGLQRATESIRHALVFDPNAPHEDSPNEEEEETPHHHPHHHAVVGGRPTRNPPPNPLFGGRRAMAQQMGLDRDDLLGDAAVSENPSENDEDDENSDLSSAAPLDPEYQSPLPRMHPPSQHHHHHRLPHSPPFISPTDPSLNSSMSTRSSAPLVGQRTLSVKTIPTRDLVLAVDQQSRDLFLVNMSVVEMSEPPTKRRKLFSLE